MCCVPAGPTPESGLCHDADQDHLAKAIPATVGEISMNHAVLVTIVSQSTSVSKCLGLVLFESGRAGAQGRILEERRRGDLSVSTSGAVAGFGWAGPASDSSA